MGYLTRKQEKYVAVAIGAGIVCVILICTVCYYQFYKIPLVKKEMKSVVEQIQELKKSKLISVARLRNDVLQGTVLTGEDIEFVEFEKDKLPGSVITDSRQISEMVTRIDLLKNTILLPSMIVSMKDIVTHDLRLQDYSHFKLNTGLLKGQFVDVRIKRKDGADDVFLSKKEILDIAGTTIFIDIDDVERMYINAATVDAAINGCELYTTIYVDAQNQMKAPVTYEINSNIMAMIEANEAIIKKAEEELREKNSRQQEEKYLNEKSNEGTGTNDESNSNNSDIGSDNKSRNSSTWNNVNE